MDCNKWAEMSQLKKRHFVFVDLLSTFPRKKTKESLFRKADGGVAAERHDDGLCDLEMINNRFHPDWRTFRIEL